MTFAGMAVPGRRESMVARLFLLFALVPVIELYLLIQIGQRMGVLSTVALVVVTGMVGATLAKQQGLKVLRDWQATLARGELPQEGLTGAALVLVGGLLLITPGVLTDFVGLFLLIPSTRRWIAQRVRARIEKGIGAGTIRMTQSWGPSDFLRNERVVRGEAQVRPSDAARTSAEQTKEVRPAGELLPKPPDSES